MRILFLGDLVGKVGRRIVRNAFETLRTEFRPDFVICNGENAAAGVGITSAIAKELLDLGFDAITLGNHAFQKREITEFLESETRIIRPANFPKGTPGRGWTTIQKDGLRLSIANFCGRVFMSEYEDPFRSADTFIESCETPYRLIDFHAEATSEKRAFAEYVDGRVSVVLGTHTHVQTADEQILKHGTAFLTDVGMCGPEDSIIGMDKEVILRRFLTLMPERFEVADGLGVISGVVVDVKDTGAAECIQRILWRGLS